MRPKPTRRQSRYTIGQPLERGWSWRTTGELLTKMEARRKQLGMEKTEYIEHCVKLELAQARKEHGDERKIQENR